MVKLHPLLGGSHKDSTTMNDTTKPDMTIDTCELGEDETRVIRVFVGDYYDEEKEELEMSVDKEGITFSFFSFGSLVDSKYLTHEELFLTLSEGRVPEEL